jgi:hypothetical protein
MPTIWRDALWSGRNRHFPNSKTRSVRYAFCAQFLSQQARQDGRAWRAAMITGENPLAAGPSPHGRCAREAPLWRRAAYRAAHRCPIASNNTPERKRRSSGRRDDRRCVAENQRCDSLRGCTASEYAVNWRPTFPPDSVLSGWNNSEIGESWRPRSASYRDRFFSLKTPHRPNT